MARREKYTPEQVLGLLRKIETAMANGKPMDLACQEAAISKQMFYSWRREYGTLQTNQTRRLKQLESENAKLKRLVLALEKLTLKETSSAEF